MDKRGIRNILTIRYDPTKKLFFPKAIWRDFCPSISDPSGSLIQNLLLQSIRKQIPDNQEPISISLSGGIDSTLCLSLLRYVFPKKKIYSICGVFEEGFDESKIAKKVARKFNANFVIVKMKSIFSNMPEIISITKKPRWNTYNHLIAKEAKKHSKILVTGDGADELFGGYTFRYKKFLNLSRPTDNWKIKTLNYLEGHNRDWVPDQEKMFGTSIKFSWNEIFNYFKPYFSNPLNPLQQVMLADFNGKLLYDFIPTGKQIFSYYYIKGAQLFLDKDIISSALRLPIEQKYDPKTNKGKLVLRTIAAKLDIPHLDEKRGFSPSLLFDWEKNGKYIFKNFLIDSEPFVFKKKLINPNWLYRAFETVENDGDMRYLNRLISILALEIWHRIFISKDISHKQKLG